MKIITKLLVGTVALAASAMVYAQEPVFRATGLSCDQVTWSQAALQSYPRIASACQEVMQREGKYFIRFDGEVRNVTDRGQQVTIDFRDGDRLTLTPPENLALTINDRPTTPRDLRPGDQLKFYIPEDQLTAVFFAGLPETGPAQTVPMTPVPEVQVAAATPAPRALPGTAGSLPILAIVGMILVMFGATLTVRRRLTQS
jgi:hypothetical protein